MSPHICEIYDVLILDANYLGGGLCPLSLVRPFLSEYLANICSLTIHTSVKYDIRYLATQTEVTESKGKVIHQQTTAHLALIISILG